MANRFSAKRFGPLHWVAVDFGCWRWFWRAFHFTSRIFWCSLDVVPYWSGHPKAPPPAFAIFSTVYCVAFLFPWNLWFCTNFSSLCGLQGFPNEICTSCLVGLAALKVFICHTLRGAGDFPASVYVCVFVNACKLAEAKASSICNTVRIRNLTESLGFV